MKNLVLFLLIVLTVLVAPVMTFAEQKEAITVEKKNGMVTININEEGSYYKIFKDDSLIYEGYGSEFSEKMDYPRQKYRIGVFVDNNLTNVYQINVANDSTNNISLMNHNSKQDYIKNVFENTSLESIVSQEEVTLNWIRLPDEDGIYEIYRNDQKIAETKDTSYVDRNIEPNKQYYYTVKIENKLTDKERERIVEENKNNKYFSSIEELKEMTNEVKSGGTLRTLVLIPDNSEKYLKDDMLFNSIFKSDTEFTTTKSPPPFFDVVYRTYIPFKSVKDSNPFPWARNYLKGDNRQSYMPYSDKYRTEARVYAQLDYPPAITLWSDVSKTYSCETRDCLNPIDEGRASSSGIKLHKNKELRNDLEWRVTHNVGIPISPEYPNINYGYHAIVKSNSFQAYGTHDKAPSHEAWLNSPGESIRIHGYQVKDEKEFWRLIGIITEQWNFTL